MIISIRIDGQVTPKRTVHNPGLISVLPKIIDMSLKLATVFFLLLNTITFMINAQKVLKDTEIKEPNYSIPELLTSEKGIQIKTIRQWETIRRPELLALFESEVYGKQPKRAYSLSYKILKSDTVALQNTAVRKQCIITITTVLDSLQFNLLLYIPKNISQPPPVFLGYNFYGNHTITNDPAVYVSKSWVKNSTSMGTYHNTATEVIRGKRAHRWPIDAIIKSGFAIATIHYGDVDPDKNDFSDGIHALLNKEPSGVSKNQEWGSIAAWALGLSRIMDYLVIEENVDAERVIVFGHSRLGKAALWAGALDQRFSMIISNDSGCGGAALFRRKEGETIKDINTNFPHWFAAQFKKYNDNEDKLPVDQHMLLSLIAPRPVYIASAENDLWADSKGEYLSAYYASPVYELYGKEGMLSGNLPQVDQPVHQDIGYHIRKGDHDLTIYDWLQFIAFAKKHFLID